MGTDSVTAEGSGPVKIRNRDIPLLADIFTIMQDIRQIEERREWQKGRMFNITQHLTGMPGGGGMPKGLDETFALLSEIDDEHKRRCKSYVRQLRKAQKILNGIESHTNMTRRGFERARDSVENAPCMAAVKWQERYILVEDSQVQICV